ncbi:amino acid adenylation domain-containing protein [Lentzea sp. NPDC051213]|uniref:amino acid adenylation domain-containing protein n=1 Tax=Lentzea sp. NPDC051213 TaxID=3364126 RepID=UPI00378F8ADA
MTTIAGVAWSALPLSEEQLGLLYVQRTEPDSARYHVPIAFELTGEVDVPALERTLAALVRRHPVLTAIPADLTMSADPSRTIPLSFVEVPGLSGDEAVALLQAESVAPLDIDVSGMSRAVLVTAAPDRHYLLLVVHHVVLDGEASGVLVADLWRHYAAERSGTSLAPEQTEPSVYVPVAVDQEPLRDYWREVVAGGCLVELPSDGAGEPGTADVSLEIDAGPVNAFARRNRVGVFAVLLAAYQRTLARYARQERVAVAVPVSTRRDPRLDGVVGCFVNTVPVRSPAGADLLPADYVRASQAELARAIDHAALPFPRIAELAGAGEVFNCVFTYQSWYDHDAFGDRVPGLRIRLLEEVHQPVVGDLTLEMFADGSRLRGRLRYATDRFAAGTVAAFAAQLVSTVEAMAVADVPVGELADVAVRQDLTTCDFDRDADVDQLLRGAASEFADRVALREGSREWTYRSLDEHVGALAAGLRANGVRAGDTVGIWLPRSADQVLAVLAVLRVGAVFVPLDPAHPDHRLDDIARRAQLALVIREESDRATPGGVRGVQLTDLLGAHPPVEPGARAGEPAYVLFTSGSTGVPKGVVVGHRAFVNHLAWSRRYFDVTPDDVMAFSGTLSFDVTLHQLFVPLVCGACLVVVPDGEQRDPDVMAETLRRNEVTLLHVVPALLRLLVDSPAFGRNSALRAVVSAGEALTNHLRRACQEATKAKLYNAYGPTEATVYATVFDASTPSGRWTGQADVPIGDPLDNIRCHVLDERLRPVPPGAPGELCLAGDALADGYHDDPERTAEQFREVELDGVTERIYRTGDLVRELPGGGLSYLGRLDHQVKLNGFRVELGEVEAAMLAAPGVRDAVAIVRRHDDGHGQLIGYVTPSEVDVEAVRAVLADRLPPYMVPPHLLALAEFPRLPSGKTDRKLLPAPAPVAVPVQQTRARAGTAALELVRAAWADVLGRVPGDQDHFFTAGGDSILAMRLVSALRRKGLKLDVRELHRSPVLADLAAAVGTGVDIAPEPVDAPRWAPIQEWFFATVRTDQHHWNQSVLLELTRPVDRLVLSLAVQSLTLVHPELGDPKRVFDAVEITSAEERDRAIHEVQRSLDPTDGELVRARLLHNPEDCTDLLLLVVHHLAVDGVSWRILLEDLDLAVAALEQGELPRLPDEGQSYRSWLAGLAADEATIAYWRSVARRRQAVDGLSSTSTGVEGETRRTEAVLDEDTTARLLGSTVDMPIHDVLTGLVALALARWRGCGTVTFDVETHGRQTATGDVSRTVGWFTALYPVVLGVERTADPLTHLAAVRDELAAVPDGGVGFGLLRAEFDDLPKPLVCFNYLGQIDSSAAGERFTVVDGAVPGERSPRAERTHTVELYGIVRDGRLRLGATWAPAELDGVDEHGVEALLAQLTRVISELTANREPESVPLNSQQYGILVDSLARRGTGRYVEQMSWVWHGPLDVERFTAAWRHTARRHAALRAAFNWDGTPCLLVHPDVEPEVRVHSDTAWDDLLAADRARGFDLGEPALLRLALVPDGQAHRVLLSFHHALLDGWSTALVLEDFYLHYLGHPRPIDPDEPDARTHARWLEAQDTTDAEGFWSSRLCGLDPATAPGISGEAVAEQGVGRVEVRFPAERLAELRAVVSTRAATENTVLQTIWAALLWRFAGTTDDRAIAFGVTLSGRGIDLPGAERIPGLLMTTLPLTVQVRPDEQVLDLVGRVREAALDTATFEWVSTGQVHDWSGRPGSVPLFESLLVVENYPSSLGEVGRLLADAGIAVEQPTVKGAETAYPCTLLLHHDDKDVVLTVVHDRTVIGTDSARRIAELWQEVLTRLERLDSLTVAELVDGLGDLPVVAPRPQVQSTVLAEWPDEPLTETVKQVWRQVLGVPEVLPSDHFFESGGHSLLAGRFLREIGERCGTPVRLDDLLANPTAAAFAAALGGQTEVARTPIVPLCPGLEPVLYLIHPPGGQVACYAEFARRYDGPEAVFGIRDPRVDEPGEPVHRSVPELAEHYLRLLLPRLTAAPIVLGGFSGGGVLAQELARLVHRETGRTPLVLLIDAAAPTGATTDTEADNSFLNQVRSHDREGSGTGETPETGAAYLDELAAVADWMTGTGQGDPYALLATTLAAIERHEPQPYPGPVALFRAADTTFGGDADFAAAADYYRTPGLGWEDHCPDLTVHIIPGNHVSLLTGENVQQLARNVAGIVRRHREGNTR